MLETSRPTAAAAGWFPDPWGSGVLRWWDGTQWTGHLQQPVRPAPPQPAFYGQGSGFSGIPRDPRWNNSRYGGASGPLPRGKNNTVAWVALVVGLGAMAAVFVSVALPTSSQFLPIVGLVAIGVSMFGIDQYNRRKSSNLWAPIVGLTMGVLSVVLVVVLIVMAFAAPGARSASSDVKPLAPRAYSAYYDPRLQPQQ